LDIKHHQLFEENERKISKILNDLETQIMQAFKERKRKILSTIFPFTFQNKDWDSELINLKNLLKEFEQVSL